MRSYFAAATLAAFMLAACGQQGAPTADSSGEAARSLADTGRTAFSACAICHSTKDPAQPGYAPMVGPSLFGVYGAKSGHIADYSYSQAMREAGVTWDDASLDGFIANPQQIIPRTRMAFVGEPDAAKREAIIAYLKTLK